jgi:hypothetical protein
VTIKLLATTSATTEKMKGPPTVAAATAATTIRRVSKLATATASIITSAMTKAR